MQSKSHSLADEQLESSTRAAPGAVPPTGGAVPEDAQPRRSKQKHDVDELVDALGLLLRAARDLDPGRSDARLRSLELRTEHTIVLLQELEVDSFDPSGNAARSAQVAELALTTREELANVVERALTGIRATFFAR